MNVMSNISRMPALKVDQWVIFKKEVDAMKKLRRLNDQESDFIYTKIAVVPGSDFIYTKIAGRPGSDFLYTEIPAPPESDLIYTKMFEEK